MNTMYPDTNTTVLTAPVAAGAGRPLNQINTGSIPQMVANIKDEDTPMSEEEFDRIATEAAFAVTKEKEHPYHLEAISMTDLYNTSYISKPPIIDGLLHRGTYLFAGAPKLGKSFFMMQLAYHVSTGTPLWGYPVQQGDVLYLSLEDTYSRLQERLYRMFGTEPTDHLHLCVSAHSISEGLAMQLGRYMAHHPGISLIIIDTLQKVREACSDTYSYTNDYQLIAFLKEFAEFYGICLILVHHTRKQHAEDCFDMVSGTTGLTGAADGTFVLHKEKRTGNTAILEITGRDQQDQKLHLTRNEDKLTWELTKRETELWKAPPDPLLEKIAQRIRPDQPNFSGTPTELCQFLDVDIKPNALTQRLNINVNRLLHDYHIYYWNKRTHLGRQVGLQWREPKSA